MSTKPLNNIWIRRQQCPCGDWKCYIKYEEDNQTTRTSELIKPDNATSSSSDVIFTPYVGQIFKSDDEGFEYYCNFARKNGFSIRKARSTESQNLGVYRRDFVCYRSGFNQPRKKANVEHPRDRKSVRCGCDGKLYLTKEILEKNVTQWYVSQFSNIHNHELLEDDQVRLLPAYRKIQESDQERILLLTKAGFPVNRIIKVLELEKGVQPGQLPFIEKDVRNFVRTCKKTVQENDALLTEKKENDMLELLEMFRVTTEQRGDGFVYNYTTDENGKVENVSWAFGDSIRAFSVFGDVVMFETTYRSITYNVLFGAWFGIDNQGKAFLLGCVLLQDESSHSFSWALQAFVRFLRGNHPQTIVTDIDSGLRDAIAAELPNTKHVICIWHVLSKLSSWFSLPLGLQFPEFKSEFELVCHLENVEDFENQWSHLVNRFGIESDKHVALLFSYRAFWPVAYIRGYFLARIMTVDYVKSMDKFMKNILSPHSSFKGFFEQVSVSANIAFQKKERIPYLPIKTSLPLEEHAQSILSPYAFNALQQEIVLCMQYATTDMNNGSYLVRHYNKLEGECLVIWIPDNEQVHCSCKEYEHSGILCRHSIRILVLKNYFQIPEKYFPLRWRLDSSLVIPDDHIMPQDSNGECSEAFNALTSSLYSESLISKERFSYVHREMNQILETVRNMPVFDEVGLDLGPNNVSEI